MTETNVPDGFDKVESIAVIGMSGRFAKANNLAEFWKNLCDGTECTTFFSAEELLKAGCKPDHVNQPNYVRATPFLKDIDQFAASFFNIPPSEAEILDPQQRIFLESCWETLEDAAYDPETYAGWIGVFAGGSTTSYMLNNLYPYRHTQPVLAFSVGINNEREYLATRVAYKLNLKGPSLSVITACSTSLVAAHLACQSLLSYQCDMALAGGVSIGIPQESGYFYREGSIFSPDGHCRPFDAQARGTVFGSGVGVVLLKRLSDALQDGDHIYAVIKGSAVNNDGSAKVGFTAPGVEGQVNVIAMAYQAANVDPGTVTYVQTHGTGTELGDPIEVETLTRVFRAYTDKKQFCAITSIKGCIGHTDAAAGVANLIATSLALKHRVLPPNVNYKTPNPKINFPNSPFFVNTELREWKSEDAQPRRAGVSAFGIGGTNAHVILEEAIENEPSGQSRRYQQLALSARTETALEKATDNLAAYLLANPQANLADVAYTLHMGRRAFEFRRTIICETISDAIAALQEREPKRVLTESKAQTNKPVVFMFPGQGAQYINMGRGLYDSEPLFRQQVDVCAERLKPHLGLDLRNVLYPAGVAANDEQAAEQLNQTRLTQPALFVIEYALAQLWMSWGIKPQAMVGHSIGEYVAACLAGVFDPEDALALVAARGRLMQSMPHGAMLSLALPEKAIQPFLSGGLAVATINEPSGCVVAGPTDAVAILEQVLNEKGIGYRRLHTSHAFHSPMMEPILTPFREQVSRVTLRAPQLAYLSNVTGTWITPEQATDPGYWAQHLRQTVRFSDNLSVLAQKPDQVLLEVGPGNTLRTFAQRHPNRSAEQFTVASMRHPRENQDDQAVLLQALGQLWMGGVAVDWNAFYRDERRLRLSLPTYPFERQRYWIDPPEEETAPVSLYKNPDIANWFYVPSWKRTMPPVQEPQGIESRWLLFGEGDSLSTKLAQQLQAQGQPVVMVLAGEQFTADGNTYTIRPAHRDDYDVLLSTLKQRGQSPIHVVHLWNVAPGDESAADFTDNVLQRSFYSLLFLAQALGAQNLKDLQLTIVSSNVHQVTGGEMVHPEKATLLGPCKVIPQEMPSIVTRSIDLVLPQAGSPQEAQLVAQLIAELASSTPDSIIAYRGRDRWVQTYEPTPLAEWKGNGQGKLRQGGVYLITGGLGGIGLTLAEYLAQTVQAKLVLISRSRFPERARWEQWLATHHPQDRTSLRIRDVRKLEALGAEVMVVQADVADQHQMEAAVRAACERFGEIHGVIHSAGLPGGGVMQLKEKEAALNVLMPKVYGTRVLDAVLHDMPLDFFVLCSSLAAATGGLGQVDYTAANAFMDAFAHAHQGCNHTMTASINWDAWAEVGMAFNTAPTFSARTGRAQPAAALDHPLLSSFYQETEGRTVYQMELSPAKHWVLSDHVLLGIPTIPGTTHLELARAAFAHHTHNAGLEIREAIFLVPMMVGVGDSKQAQLILDEQADGFDFQVQSKAGVATDGTIQWQTHVTGNLARLTDAPSPYDVEGIRARCNVTEIVITDEMRKRAASGESMLQFGPRWGALQRVQVGHDEGIAWIELDRALLPDLEGFKLHPALLDTATSFFASLVADTLHLPLSYKRAHVYQSLPDRVYSYVRLKPTSASDAGIITARVTLIDEQGQVLMDVEEFTMRRVDETAASRLRGATDEIAPEREGQATTYGPPQRDLGDAILPQEGVEAFQRILFRNRLPQILVSTRHLPTLIRRANESTPTRLLEQAAQPETTRAKHSRPNLQTAYVAPRNQVEEKLAAVWGEALGIEKVGIHDNFFELGGDSLLGVQVVAKIRAVDLQASAEQIFQNQTIAQLAQVLGQTSTAQVEQGPITGPVPLTPNQYLFLVIRDAHFPVLLQMFWQLDPTLLTQALRAVLLQHDILRARYAREFNYQEYLAAQRRASQTGVALEPEPERQWIIAPEETVPFTYVDMSALSEAEQTARLESTTAHLEAELSASDGPVLQLAYFNAGPERPGYLFLAILHLVCDYYSIQILLEDLMTAYQQLAQGQALQLPPKTTSYKSWAEHLAAYARTAEARAELNYWNDLPWDQVGPLPVDNPAGLTANTAGSAREFNLALEAEETEALLARYGANVQEILLAAIGVMFRRWAGNKVLLMTLVTNGRGTMFSNVDVSRTVGLFGVGYPLVLDIGEDGLTPAGLQHIRDQLARVPNQGLTFGVLHRLSDPEIGALMEDRISRSTFVVNYWGRTDMDQGEQGSMRPMPHSFGHEEKPDNNRMHILKCTAGVREGRFVLSWEYSVNIHRAETIERIAQYCLEALRAFTNQPEYHEANAVALTPADFPEAGLDQESLTRLIDQLKRE